MSKFFKIASIAGVFALVLTLFSCNRSDDPSDNDLFVGTYKNGTISYADSNNPNDNKEVASGTVTVVKTGDKYHFVFSDGIPNLTGVEIKKGSNYLITADFEEGVKGVKITANNLFIIYQKDGKTWKAINLKR